MGHQDQAAEVQPAWDQQDPALGSISWAPCGTHVSVGDGITQSCFHLHGDVRGAAQMVICKTEREINQSLNAIS